VTLSAAGAGVLVGVVADVGVADVEMTDAGAAASPEISSVVVGTEQQTWVEVRWTPSAS
jgi:hypothetical protein